MDSRNPPLPTSVWSTPGDWPMDPAGYIFLAPAALRLGKARFGDDWTGTEFRVFVPARIAAFSADTDGALRAAKMIATIYERDPDEPAAAAIRAEEVRRLVERQRVAAENALRSMVHVSRAPPMAPSPTPAAAPPTPVDWTAPVNAIVEQLELAAAPFLERKEAVMREIVRRCEAGDLSAFSRTPSGEMVPLLRAAWNVDRHAWIGRFNACTVEAASAAKPAPDKLFLALAPFEALLRGTPGDGAELWGPARGQTLKEWCVLAAPSEEGRRRASQAVSANPSDRDICKALARMWEQARGANARWNTIEQYRVAHRKAQNGA